MKKLLLSAVMFSGLAFGQTVKDAEVLLKIKGQDINKVGSILKLKPNSESKTKLDLTSNYFTKGDISYSASEDIDNNKADRVLLMCLKKGEANERFIRLCREFESNKDYTVVNYIYKLPGKVDNFGSLQGILQQMQKLSFADNDAELTAYFLHKDGVIFKVNDIGLNLLAVGIQEKK